MHKTKFVVESNKDTNPYFQFGNKNNEFWKC